MADTFRRRVSVRADREHAVATVLNDADAIRRQMATIRRDLHQDVQQVVATAEAATDWRRYLTAYPWATIGAAFAVGYLVVPRRHKSSEVLANMATHADVKKIREAIEDTGQKAASLVSAQEPKKERGKGLIGAALGMLIPLALKAAQGYALKYAEQWIMQQQLNALHGGPPPPSMPGEHPGAPGPKGQGNPGPSGFGTGPGRPSNPRQQPGGPNPYSV